jgi:mono/diheme cytochrome c family protein/uncharacterized protein (DUF302 family)
MMPAMHLTSLHKILFTSLLLTCSSYSLSAHANNRGEALYEQNCAICHGSEGTGGMGAQLASQTFLESASNQYLKQTIRLGRPGRIMPSFYWMPESDIDAIISFIGHWRKTPAHTWPGDAIDGDAIAGQKLYTSHCASCHGKQAGGGIGTGMHFSRPTNLPVTAPALNNQGLLNAMPDHMMRHMIVQKRVNSLMPSADQLGLNTQQVNNIVSYIRSFQQKDLKKQPLYDEEPASLIVESPYSFEETISNIKRSITGSNFIHIRDQELTEGFNVEQVKGSRQTMIYFCNFNFLYEALKIDPRVGMFLPCRITVTEENGTVQMMSINPKHLSQLFNNSELNESCDKMHEVYINILEDASL